MAITTPAITFAIDRPKDKARLPVGEAVEFRGVADPTIQRVELHADRQHLGTAVADHGQWRFEQPRFSQGGVRNILAVGFDSSHRIVARAALDLIVTRAQELGIDVSDHNGVVDWARVRQSGQTFAICKATEGITFQAESFERNWKGVENAGLVRGAYHFFRPGKDPELQADNFLRTVDRLRPSDLPPILDLEHFPEFVAQEWAQLSKSQRVKNVQTWIDRVQHSLRRRVMIYTSFGFWTQFMDGVTDLSRHPLWVANYTSRSQPFLPEEWDEWTFWQFTDQGSVDGVPSASEDLNRFNGSYDKLTHFIESTHIS